MILIDCPPTLGLLTVNALVAADHALLSTEAQYFALQGVEQAMEVIDLARESLNPELELLGVVLNIANMRTRHARQTLDSLRERFGEKVCRTVIRQSIAYAESAERAVPILDYRPDRGADYLALAGELLRRLGRQTCWAARRALHRDRPRRGSRLMNDADSATALEAAIARYNDAWNAHDLDAIMAMHAPDMVFENHTAHERGGRGRPRPHRRDLRDMARHPLRRPAHSTARRVGRPGVDRDRHARERDAPRRPGRGARRQAASGSGSTDPVRGRLGQRKDVYRIGVAILTPSGVL